MVAKGKRRQERPYFFLNAPCSEETNSFPLSDWQAMWHRRRFLPVFPQKCVLGKVEQPVKQHLDCATLKFSAENNTNELPRNSFQTMSKSDFPLRVTPMNPFKTVFRPNQTEILFSSHPPPHHCTKWTAGAPVAAAPSYLRLGIATAWHLSAASTRGDYSVLTSKEVCLTWVWRCAGRASPWSSLPRSYLSPTDSFCCNTTSCR